MFSVKLVCLKLPLSKLRYMSFFIKSSFDTKLIDYLLYNIFDNILSVKLSWIQKDDEENMCKLIMFNVISTFGPTTLMLNGP